VPELQNLFIQQACKNILKIRSTDLNSEIPLETKELTESARILVKYNTVWMLTQFLFCVKQNFNIKLPEETVNRLKTKISD
jgi:hypothetical protein